MKSKLFANSLNKGFDVNVETSHGVVMLKVTLANEATIERVNALAEKVDGVKSTDTTELKVAGK